MRLIKLQIENLGKIRAALFDFDNNGHLVRIVGENEAGKSTVLDAIGYLITGKVPGKSVTDGEEKGEIVGQVDDFTITRKINADGKTTVKVMRDGMTMGSPQKFLDSIASKFLDPTSLVELSGKECRAQILKNLGVNTDSIDREINEIEINRREAGRRMKAMGEPVPVAKVDPVNISETFEQIHEIENFNRKQQQKEEQLKAHKSIIKEDRRKILELEEEIRLLVEDIAQTEDAIESIGTIEDQRDTSELYAIVHTGNEVNEKHLEYKRYLEKKKQYEAESSLYRELTDRITEKREERIQVLTDASKGLSGVEITDDGVVYKGHVWERLSTSEALTVATDICMSLTPKNGIRALFVKRGESLLSKAREQIAKIAEENDFQIIMEVAAENTPEKEPGVFYIVDGEVRG